MIYFVSGNEIKLREVRTIIPEIQSYNIDLTEIQSLSPRDIIENKLEQAQKIFEKDQLATGCVVDDISFGLSYLNGMPGTLVKWWEKCIKAAKYYDIAEKEGNFDASVTHALGYIDRSGNRIILKSTHYGKVVAPQKGIADGFYEVFVPAKGNLTYSQIEDPAERMKNHPRGDNLKKLRSMI